MKKILAVLAVSCTVMLFAACQDKTYDVTFMVDGAIVVPTTLIIVNTALESHAKWHRNSDGTKMLSAGKLIMK